MWLLILTLITTTCLLLRPGPSRFPSPGNRGWGVVAGWQLVSPHFFFLLGFGRPPTTTTMTTHDRRPCAHPTTTALSPPRLQIRGSETRIQPARSPRAGGLRHAHYTSDFSYPPSTTPLRLSQLPTTSPKTLRPPQARLQARARPTHFLFRFGRPPTSVAGGFC